MWKKIIIISLCISVLFVFSAPISYVNAGQKKVKVNWQIAGTIVGLIPLISPIDGMTDLGGHTLLNLYAQGSPGPAKITTLSTFNTTPPLNIGSCPDEYQLFPAVYFVKNDAVAVFPDQSLLFVSINATDRGILCTGATGTYFKVQLVIHGGTGRFDGASGDLTAEGYGSFVASDVTLSGENGTITGTIEFSDL